MLRGIQAAGLNVLKCAVYHSANQSVANNTTTLLNFDSTDVDNAAMHFTSSAALTGTVGKTSGSAAVTGSGTAFLTELSVGQVITIPGTQTEKFVVIAIADNTHLTLNRNAANSASGQTATRVNGAITCRQAGTYVIGGICRFASNATGVRLAQIIKNNQVGINGTILVNSKEQPVNGDSTDWALAGRPVALALWDILEMAVLQASGGALNVESVAPAEPSLWAYRIGP